MLTTLSLSPSLPTSLLILAPSWQYEMAQRLGFEKSLDLAPHLARVVVVVAMPLCQAEKPRIYLTRPSFVYAKFGDPWREQNEKYANTLEKFGNNCPASFEKARVEDQRETRR